ncbi:MAG: MFS transporter [Acidobacteria bacterium]|nr:MFS transporter [Acidobacteriota bacterium]
MLSSFRLPIRAVLIFWMFLLSALAYLDRTNISIAGPQISREFGLGNVKLGWVFSAFLIGYALAQVPAGWLAVRYGPRWSLTFGVAWWGVFTALTAVVPPKMRGAMLVLIAVRFCLGAGEATVYPASNQLVARWIPLEERGKANGSIFAGVGAGAGLTPPLLAWIIAHYGWRMSFWFSAVVGTLAGVVWFFIARDHPAEHPLISQAELRHIEEGIAEPQAVSVTSEEKAVVPWTAMFRSRTLFALTLSYFSFGYVAWVFFAWFYIYLAEARGLDLKASAIYSMFPFLAMTICSPLGGIANDWISRRFGLRWGRCGVGVAALATAAVLLWFGPAVSSTQLASLILAGGAGTLYFAQSSYWSVTVDIADSGSGIVSGVMNMGAQVGGAVTASLTPVIAARYGWNASFRLSAMLALAGAVAWVIVDPAKKLGRERAVS